MKRWLIRFELPLNIAAVLLLFAAIGIVFLLFPGINNLWVSILVLASGLLTALCALIAVLRDRESR